MSKKKICKSCKMFIEADECPVCHSAQFANSFKGRLHILDAGKSDVAKKIGVSHNGEYAIKLG